MRIAVRMYGAESVSMMLTRASRKRKPASGSICGSGLRWWKPLRCTAWSLPSSLWASANRRRLRARARPREGAPPSAAASACLGGTMPQFESDFFSSLIFWEVLSFAILFVVLYKYAFPGILGMLEEREKKIKDSLDQAERHRAAAERTLKEYEAKLHLAAKEAEGILAAAKDRAQRLMEEHEQRMTVEAERIKGDATREIEHARRKAIQEIRAHTTELALLVAEKVVQRSLTDADHRKFAEEALAALAQSSPRLCLDPLPGALVAQRKAASSGSSTKRLPSSFRWIDGRKTTRED